MTSVRQSSIGYTYIRAAGTARSTRGIHASPTARIHVQCALQYLDFIKVTLLLANWCQSQHLRLKKKIVSTMLPGPSFFSIFT